MNGDLREAVQMLAGDNARLCTITLAADELAREVEKMLEAVKRTPEYTEWRCKLVQSALDAFKIARQGQ
jgi:hypothetical protein